MVEMLGVLAIIGVLSVAGIAGYSRAMTKYRTNKTIDQVTMLVTNIRTLYAQQNNFAGLNNAEAYNLGVIPDDLIPNNFNNDKKLRNAFKGQVFINPTKANSSDDTSDTAFEIAFQGLSRDACIAMATSDWGSGSASGLVSVTFQGTSAEASNAKMGTPLAIGTGAAYRGVGCEGKAASGSGMSAGDGHAIACPSGSYRLPLSVADSSKACNCTGANANQCSITWIYF